MYQWDVEAMNRIRNGLKRREEELEAVEHTLNQVNRGTKGCWDSLSSQGFEARAENTALKLNAIRRELVKLEQTLGKIAEQDYWGCEEKIRSGLCRL